MKIWFSPKIKALKAKNIGVWKDVEIKFSDDLNIITGPSASGKTTLLKCIIAAVYNKQISERYLHDDSEIEIVLEGGRLKPCLKENTSVDKSLNTAAEIEFEMLLNSLRKMNEGYAILIDDVGCMDEKKLEKVFNLIKQIKGQKIITVKQPLNISDARVFECVYDDIKGSSKITAKEI